MLKFRICNPSMASMSQASWTNDMVHSQARISPRSGNAFDDQDFWVRTILAAPRCHFNEPI